MAATSPSNRLMAATCTTRRPHWDRARCGESRQPAESRRTVLEGVSERAFEVLEQGIYYVERLGAGAKGLGFPRR